jgi:hypothetical protein
VLQQFCQPLDEVMRLARTGGQRMVVYQAAPGSPDEAALLRLESVQPDSGS